MFLFYTYKNKHARLADILLTPRCFFFERTPSRVRGRASPYYSTILVKMKRQSNFMVISKRQKNRRIAEIVEKELSLCHRETCTSNQESSQSPTDPIPESSGLNESCSNLSVRNDNSGDSTSGDSSFPSTSKEGHLEIAFPEDEESCRGSDSEENNSTHDEAPVESQLQGEVRNWALQFNIPHNAINGLLKILRSASHVDLPIDARTLLATPKFTNVQQMAWGKYIHYGVERAITDQLKNVVKSDRPRAISIDIHLDGVAISNSSKLQLWPIMGKIYSPDFEKPFFIGAYASYGKPKSISEYLQKFCEEYSRLTVDGFNFDGDHYSVTIRAVIADSPARSFATCTKSFNGFYGCGKCFIRGTRVESTTVFIETDCQLRTDANFKDRTQIQHHLDKSPFEELGLGMVTQFPLDYMHLVCLGVVKRLLKLWIDKKIITAYNLKILSDNLVALRDYVPKEFARKCRALDELERWKATELRLFLYVGLALLKDVLPKVHYKHFASLSCAVMILSDPEECIRNNDYANCLLIYFVKTMRELYDDVSVVYNIHSLIHIAADVKNLGPLDDFSAFPYESAFGPLKKLLRKSDNALAQLYNRISEQTHTTAPSTQEACNYPYLLNQSKEKLPKNCHNAHRSIRFKNFMIRTTDNDSCCLLLDGTIIIVEHIGYRGDEQVVIGRKFDSPAQIPDYPCDSRVLDIFIACELSRELHVWPVLLIRRKMFRMPLSDSHNYIIPLVHTRATYDVE